MDDSNMSENEVIDDVLLSGKVEKAKRLKTDQDSPERSDESNSKESELTGSSSNTEQEKTASSSTNDSGFPKFRSSKSRNYRKSKDDESSAEESDNTNEPNSPVNNQEQNSLESLFTTSESENSPNHFFNNADSNSNDKVDDIPVLKKQMPKHCWFVVPEVLNRQIGESPKKQSPQLFQRRCYGSLHAVQRLELMYKLEKHEGCVNSLNFHPDGSLLASGSDDLSVVVWDWKVGRPLVSFDTKHRGNVFQSKFLPLSGDLHIATCARDGQVRLAQISTQEGLRSSRKLGSHHGACHKLATLLDQPHGILSAGEDGYVLSHDVRVPKSNKIVLVLEDQHEVDLYSISANPLKSHEFCVSGRDQYVRVYDQRQCGVQRSPLYLFYPDKQKNMYELHVTCAVYNHNGSEILASYNDDSLYLFDMQSQPGTFVHEYQGHRNGATIKGVNFFGPKSEFIVSGSDCGHVYFWDRNTEAIVQYMLADHNGVVNCLEPHPQLPFICTSGLDWDVKVWVPSYEQTPLLADLAETVKTNYQYRSNYADPSGLNESQMLFTLWRYLRTSSRMRRIGVNLENGTVNRSASSSSSSSNTDSYSSDQGDDDDDLYRPPGCAPS